MDIELNISPRAAQWLEHKARVAGIDQSRVVARVLEDLAEQDLGRNGSTPEDRLQYFRNWVESLPLRPGPEVDASRDSIYDK